MTGLNKTYYEVLKRVQKAETGYFFITFPETLNTLFHPNDTKETTLDPIWIKELEPVEGEPSVDDYKATFDFSSLTTDNILVITPLNPTNNQTGLGPNDINLHENIAYQHISLADGA